MRVSQAASCRRLHRPAPKSHCQLQAVCSSLKDLCAKAEMPTRTCLSNFGQFGSNAAAGGAVDLCSFGRALGLIG